MSTAYKKLKVLRAITLVGYRYGMIVKNLYKEGKIALEGEMEYIDTFWNQYKSRDVKDDMVWSTHDNCIIVVITYQNKAIKIEVSVYDGDNFTGRRKNKKWIASFTNLSAKELSKFKNDIDCRFKEYCRNLLEEEKFSAEERRLKEIENEILTK